jgi:hypothetical protein
MAYRMTRPGGRIIAMTGLSEAISQGWAAARRHDPERTVGYFRDLLRQHPADARALHQYAVSE